MTLVMLINGLYLIASIRTKISSNKVVINRIYYKDLTMIYG